MVKEFTIATNVEYDNWIEASLNNLRIRLKIQQDAVAKTEADIEYFEGLLEEMKEKGEL